MPSQDYEDAVSYEIARRSKVCVSYDALGFFRDNMGCKRGVPVRQKAVTANNGSRMGIALRLPCDGCGDPLFSCPWYEATGVERAAEDMTDLREAGARTLKRLARQMIESR